MDALFYTFEIVVLLFKEGQIQKISKKVPQTYLSFFREVGYKMAEEYLSEGWRIYSISIENIKIERQDIVHLSSI